ncbi:MAG: hypothetical protein M1832_005842 [Thelocarpon impressellum]|nr:MAG: hypothetical protein M1832_005842 [Thelocarpon impressellum]
MAPPRSLASSLARATSRATASPRLPRPPLTPLRHYSAPPSNAIPASKRKYVPSSGTYPRGFLASGTHVGVKPGNTTQPDLALIASTVPCAAAAVFTQNSFQAAPVTVSREVLERRGGEGVRAVVVNSGCANAVTGRGGMEDAVSMGKEVDRCFAEDDDGRGPSTLVMSTGVIGQRLPIRKILSGIPPGHAALSPSHVSWLAAATAICTTDTFPKLLSQPFTLPSHPDTTYHLAGMTKGAGMIHPNMATLLGIVCTDAAVSASALGQLLAHATARSFNSISVDGDTSTNDTVALLANSAGAPPATAPITSAASPDYAAFQATLTAFLQRLAHLVVRDGEGATKFLSVRVARAPTYAAAHAVAASVATSPLVKTALYGRDANWGRVLAAVGNTPALPPGTVVPAQTSVRFVALRTGAAINLLTAGEPEAVDEAAAAKLLEEEDVEILVTLRTEEGGEEATYWTCDFSHEYVTINGDYRT